MRVLLASSHGADLSLGGAERYIADLGRGLRDRGYDVAVVSAFPVEQDALDGLTLTLHDTDWRRDPTRRIRNHAGDLASQPGRRLTAAVASIRPDLLHTSNLPGITTGIWEVARRLGISVVHTLHDYYLLCPRVTLERPDGRPCRPHPLVCGLRTRRLARWSPGVRQLIAGSQYLLDAHDGLFADAERHVVRLPMSPVAGQPLAPPREPLRTLGYLGALERSKGVANLAAAAPPLAELGVTVRVAGDGRLRPLVEEGTPGLEYVGRVTGAAKAAFMESADLAVLPSLWAEPSGPPYAVVEWLAAGRPVLVSGKGGLGEIEGMPGVIPIEPSPAGIVRAVRGLLDREAWLRALAQLAPVPDGRDVDRWLDEHEAVYSRTRT